VKAPESSRATGSPALLILDMISEFDFPDGDRLRRPATVAAHTISRLRARAHAAKVPVIYVNDTRGVWESDQRAFIARCLASRGAAVVEQIVPETQDYFMFKPRHSAFYATPLQPLLAQLRIRTLILTGVTSHQCVLFSAMDAHVREYDLVVPSDCIASGARTETQHALFILRRALRARTPQASRVRL
jgi:nicotinamidase-related amidase